MAPFATRRRLFWAAATAAVALAVAVGVTVTVSSPSPATATSVAVVIGASISQGYNASIGHDWPALAKLSGGPAARGCQIANKSISATRLLTSYPDLPSSLSRLDADALSLPGVRLVILTDIINDIQAVPHEYRPEKIVAGIRRFAEEARAAGVSTTVATITPYGGFARWDAAGERTRTAVNAALRAGQVPGVEVLDFDAALADPTDPTRIRAAFDSGDHLHPNDAGQQALATLAAQAISC